MTTRLKGFVVTLEAPTRDDDAEVILNAIRILRGVASVEPIEDDGSAQCDREMVKLELRKKIWDVLK